MDPGLVDLPKVRGTLFSSDQPLHTKNRNSIPHAFHLISHRPLRLPFPLLEISLVGDKAIVTDPNSCFFLGRAPKFESSNMWQCLGEWEEGTSALAWGRDSTG